MLNIDIKYRYRYRRIESWISKDSQQGGEGNSMDFIRRDCLERIKEDSVDLTDLVLTMSD